ncbi:MAG TPA: peptidoglycan DD-metalloendopeptidase family protein [Thermoanaerobaculia bacterium]|nr:peptidoglycan DD-metalloendopeptidase family protein [Thermoanaerobaculia bacterium]
MKTAFPSGAGRTCALLLALLVSPLFAAEPSREQELAAIRSQIAQLTTRLEQAKRQQAGLRGELAQADLALELQETRLAEALAARDMAARRVADSEAEVRRLESAATGARESLGRRLAGLYRLGRQGYLRLVFALRPDDRLIPSVRLMRYLAQRDRQTVDRYQQAQQRLARQRDRLLAEREDMEGWIADERSRRQQLAALRTRKATLLARAEQERQGLAARAGALADREKKLANFLDLLYGRNTAVLAGTPMQEFRGILDRPVAGEVTAGFGPRLDPRYKTKVPHNGLDFASPPGSEVKAVFPGKVLYAAPFQGYGQTVIVHHPGRVFTLYAGLSEARVGPGAMLSLGDVVGLASDRLYFEIRVENRPDDPLRWIR